MATWKKIITSGSAAELSSLALDTALPVGQGGTGATTLTDGGVLLGSGTGAITAMGVLSNGQMIVGDGTTDPVAESGATLRTSIGVGTGDNVQFTNITGTGNTTLGNGAADTHTFVGHITASAYKISASAFIGDGSGLTGVGTDIDGLDALGGTGLHQTEDHFLFSDNGTEKKITFSNLEDAIFGNVSGDATIAAGGALTIEATAVENGMLADNAVDTEEIADDAVTTAKITDANVTLAKIANAAGNTVIVRDASSSGVLSAKAVTDTQILIGDGTGFTAAALSGDVTMTNAGVTSVGDNKIGNDELKQDDDITLQSLTLTGDLTVNGTTTTIATTNTKVEDKFMFLATGSAATNTDAGIMVQSGSVDLSGSAFYHDVNVVAGTNPNGGRWSVAKSVGQDVGAVTPLQFVSTVKTDTVNPDTTSGSYGAGEMHVNTTSGEIWIRFG
jgi:hypothetical protein